MIEVADTASIEEGSEDAADEDLGGGGETSPRIAAASAILKLGESSAPQPKERPLPSAFDDDDDIDFLDKWIPILNSSHRRRPGPLD